MEDGEREREKEERGRKGGKEKERERVTASEREKERGTADWPTGGRPLERAPGRAWAVFGVGAMASGSSPPAASPDYEMKEIRRCP